MVSGIELPSQQSTAIDLNIARLNTLEKRFNERLIGQPQAVSYVSGIIRQIVAGFFDEKKPFGVWLFAGPTGVGKTEMAKMVADEFDWPFHRYDMTEFGQEHTVGRFLGSPPGYVNSSKGGELVNDLKKSPCVVLFDEIEKAHVSITKIFFQLFDEGHLTDSMGNKVSTNHVIFIMTTNLGSKMNFKELSTAVIDKQLKRLFIQRFSPEFYSRLQKIVIFNPLDKSSLVKITENYFVRLVSSIENRKNMDITWDSQVIALLSKNPKGPQLGARGVHERVRRSLLKSLTEHWVSGVFRNGDSIHISVKSEQLVVTLVAKSKVVESSETLPVLDSQPTSLDVHQVLTRKGNEVYLDRRGVTADQLVGKYALRLRRMGDNSYTDRPYKILIVSKDGEIVLLEEDGILGICQHKLDSSWNDENWVLPSPTTCGKSFFKNLCLDIADPSNKQMGLKLVDEIFKQNNIKYLSTEHPFTDLKGRSATVSNKQEFLSQVEALEKLLGPIRVNLINIRPHRESILPKKEGPKESGPISSKNYTFEFLPSKL